MNRFVAIIALCVGCSLGSHAQTFLDRLQKSEAGQGKVTIHQTATINELVNGNSQQPATGSQKPTATGSQKPTGSQKSTGSQKPSTSQQLTTSGSTADKEPLRAAPDKLKTETAGSSTSSTTTIIPNEETRKKVPSKSYKTSGYRVQVFAGGNTRADRQKAERIGNELKSNFPSEPIYVHFYSPRWICRMGNYRSYEEAHRMLQSVKELGYKQATVVKGKITVIL